MSKSQNSVRGSDDNNNFSPFVMQEFFKILLQGDAEERMDNTKSFGSKSSFQGVNYLLFSARETRNRHKFQIIGANTILIECRLQSSKISGESDFYCPWLRDFFFFPSPIQPKLSKQQQQMEQFLGIQELLSGRLYFQAFQILLGFEFVTFLLSVVLKNPPSLGQRRPGGDLALVKHAIVRSFWPNPYQLISSTIIAMLDLRLFVAPALAIMHDLIKNQSRKSWFRLFNHQELDGNGDDWNYIFAVIVFLLGASVANLTLINWTGNSSWNGNATLEQLGYSSDVWAAAALGYLRACQGWLGFERQGLIQILGLHIGIVAATWIRFGLQMTVNRTFSLSAVGLWLAADTIGSFLGAYQVENHLVLDLIDNLFKGFHQLFRPIFDPW